MSRVVGFSLVRASDSDDSNNNSNASSNVPVSFDNVLTDLKTTLRGELITRADGEAFTAAPFSTSIASSD